MIDLEPLQELVTFQKYGTLSATAEHLLITQPTVTRKMKKLEQELGVTLFNRQVSNHITLNDTGILAANEAQKLLAAEQNFTEKVLNYDRLKNEITVGTVAPGPTRFLEHIQEQFKMNLKINHELVKPEDVINDLHTLKEKLIFTNQEISTDDIESMYLGIEYLGVGIDKFNPLSQRESVSFGDLQGLSFILMSDIGPWQKVVEDNIPHASFFYQEDLKALSQISRYSSFPFFFSNLTEATSATTSRFDNDNRNTVKINDPNNQIEFYGSYLKSERKNVQPLLKKLAQQWPE
ncbi:LysR family transcriptional regulator [Limosilactobacillus sp. STM2_1]|uniref:LysR family transcriptional regulator n=1 Tax=Limosilactobacillus rudii TaxID=2759755 RepID=A0A7W3UJA3_9LACO|nr:LysR family transcriptional regulator [Limosilactobacillus rudii]MBB1078481.1 LysR family transcriptional regulator [Limosilactobacillus rudii]MBB1096611.1 LysR family transcriptional regulator [Limosilactobacillus rudii]MCD7134193.1 LysR family transcriptional regulator [Limosilactobacillus rudii]